MTIDEYNRQLKKIENKLSKEVARTIELYAKSNLIGLITNRVIQRQKNAKGSKFSKYSKKPIYTDGVTEKSSNVYEKLAGSKSKRAKLKWITVKQGGKDVSLFQVPGGYAEIRKIEGFSNTSKSFEFTGEMWKKFGITSVRRGNTPVITLGGKTKAAQDKINDNSKREGIDIIDITKKEELLVAKEIDKQLEKIFK